LKHGVFIGQPTNGVEDDAEIPHFVHERGNAVVVGSAGARFRTQPSRKLKRERDEPRLSRRDVFA